eukprot:1893975-Pyramimonas_sp.AAC.1
MFGSHAERNAIHFTPELHTMGTRGNNPLHNCYTEGDTDIDSTKLLQPGTSPMNGNMVCAPLLLRDEDRHGKTEEKPRACTCASRGERTEHVWAPP